MSKIPTRGEVVSKIFRKLLAPKDLKKYIEFKLVSGDEYPYFEFTDLFPWISTFLNALTINRLDIDSPFFIAGLRRSGTTVFYRVMNANSQLFLYNERFPGDRMNGRGVPSENNIFFEDNSPSFYKLAKRYISPLVRRSFNIWGSKLALELAHPDPGSISFSALVNILAAFPKSKIVGITRDPRDFVISALQRGGRDVDWWIDEYLAMMKLYKDLQVKRPDNFMLAKYEDLVENPETVTKACCEFAGILFEKNMLDASQWSVKGPKEYVSSGIVANTYKWKSLAGESSEIIDKINQACFPLALDFGYENI